MGLFDIFGGIIKKMATKSGKGKDGTIFTTGNKGKDATIVSTKKDGTLSTTVIKNSNKKYPKK